MSVAETSVQAHHENKLRGTYPPQQAKIVYALTMEGTLTRRQLVNYTGIEVNAIAARCNELIEDGIIEVSYKGKCPITGRSAEFLCFAGQHIPFSERKLEWEHVKKPTEEYLECHPFRIYNRGRKGGNQYCLYKYSEQHKTYCHLKGMGRLEKMQQRAEEL